MRKDILFKSIGTVHSDFKDTSKIPIQPVFADEAKGRIIIFPEFVQGLRDLDGFSHIFLFYYLHKVQNAKLLVQPFMQDHERGIFATRAPSRPNPLGFSLVKLDKIIDHTIYISQLDVLDGTPLIDIKPFIRRFDYRQNSREGWTMEVDDKQANRRGRRE